MAPARQRIALHDRIDLVLRDGSVVQVAPGPYGKGVAVIPLLPKGPRAARPKSTVPHEPGKRGRKPRASTVWLREKLEKDSKAGKLSPPPLYVRQLLDKDDEVGLPMARTVVYRELKKYK